MTLRFNLSILTGEFERRMKEMEEPIARAATDAMTEVQADVKREGRANIAGAGFSTRWQNALRVDLYPNKGLVSLEPAVFVHHRIPYAGVFEDGATVMGKPLMWVPLPTTPRRVGNRKVTPALLGDVDLVPFRSKGGTPLLGASIKVPRSQANVERPRVSLSALRRGTSGSRGVIRTVPLFVGIRAARIPEKIDIAAICATARDSIPRLYAKFFVAE